MILNVGQISNYFFNIVERVNLTQLEKPEKPAAWKDLGIGKSYDPMRRKMKLHNEALVE